KSCAKKRAEALCHSAGTMVVEHDSSPTCPFRKHLPCSWSKFPVHPFGCSPKFPVLFAKIPEFPNSWAARARCEEATMGRVILTDNDLEIRRTSETLPHQCAL